MRACRGRIWALLYLSACASSRGTWRRRAGVAYLRFIYFVKQGTPKARSLTWQSCSRRPRTCRSSPTCAPRRPGGPDQGCRGRPRSTSRVSTPPSLSPRFLRRVFCQVRAWDPCVHGPSARCRPMKAGSVRRVSSAHILRSSVKTRLLVQWCIVGVPHLNGLDTYPAFSLSPKL